MVVDIDERALVFRFRRSVARDELRAAAGGLPLLLSEVEAVGGRWDDQSWTNRDTLGLCRRFWVLSDWLLVVIRMTGWGGLLLHE